MAIALLVAGGAMHATAVPGDERAPHPPGVEPVGGDVAPDIDVCLVGLDVSATVDDTVEAGAGATVHVRVGVRCGRDGGDPPPGGEPTPTDTPTPTATPTTTPTPTPTVIPTTTPPDDGGGDGGAGSGDDDSDGENPDDADDDDPPPVEVVHWWVTPNEVAPDEPVTVGLTLRNRYWARQTAAVELLVDGEVLARRYVRVPGEGSTNATFDRRLGAPGRYRVGIRGGGTERVRVVGSASPTPTRRTPATAEPTDTGTATTRREVGGFVGRPLVVVAFAVSTLLALGGVRRWRRARRP